MVQKYQSPVRVYKHPFELIMMAYEKRFPTCKMIPIFVGSDITNEFNSEDGAVTVIERRCKLNVEAPYLLKRFLPMRKENVAILSEMWGLGSSHNQTGNGAVFSFHPVPKIAGVEFIYFIQKNALDKRNRSLVIEAHNETFASRVIINETCKYTVHPENPEWTCFEQEASLDIKSFFGFESTVEKLAMKQYSSNIKKGKEVIDFYVNEIIENGPSSFPKWIPSNGGVHQQPVPTPPTPTGPEEAKEELALGATAATMRAPPVSCKEEEAPGQLHVHRGRELERKNSGSGDKSVKLDSEYIRQFLGELTVLQESHMIQLRQFLQEIYKEKTPKNEHILRFLKARDFSMEKAREMLCHSLAWRKRHGIDQILQTYKPPQIIEDYYAGGWHYFDRDGRPLYILRLGQMDVKGLYKAVGEEGILKHVLYVNEEGIKKTEKATSHRGHPVSACTCIVDLEGLNMRHVWRPGIRAFLRIIELVEANYPETMGRLLIVRAPRIFPVLWTLINPFIDENTRQKFMIYGGNDFKGPGGLVDFIEEQYIPDFLGGDCYCDVPHGGMVPKALYQLESDEEKDVSAFDIPLCEESLYHTAYVVRDYPHEVLIHVPERGSVITWDFDILKGDVIFTLLRCRKPISEGPHQHHVHGASGTQISQQYIDKHLIIGVDVSIVLAPSVCRETDSVQGSHVTPQSGSYILQWKSFDPSKGRTPHSFDLPSFYGHKAKIMFYTELLSSKDYRGSMSSLQSLQSSFSSLSVNTTHTHESQSLVSSQPMSSQPSSLGGASGTTSHASSR